MPDAAAFTRLIDSGLADPSVVCAAYYKALAERTQKGGEFEAPEVVKERPDPTPDTPEARMVRLRREAMWQQSGTEPEEEA
jgi:hypothetical protein